MSITSELVRSVLEKHTAFQWTVQGFGFARTKIGGVGRIHVWDARLRTPLVSDIHTHPWELRSTVVSGMLINHRFNLDLNATCGDYSLPFHNSDIATGEGGGLRGDGRAVFLDPDTPEYYGPGDGYKQKPEEIHRTLAADGTVTLLERPQGADPLEIAQVYWPAGSTWVSAEPRAASWPLLAEVINAALARWNAV